jgi:2-hydroxychromene-2-carboxylate isomerase
MNCAAAGSKAPIDFYFDFISGYGYFGSLRIHALAERHGRRVNWNCMLLGVSVMKVMGLKPLLETPLKGDYVLRDVARYMRRHGLELSRKVSDPMMDPRPAARAFCWVKRHHPGLEGAFAQTALDRYWRLGRDISISDELVEAANGLAIDAQSLRQGLDSEESRVDLRDSVSAALARGVFGSPFVFVDDEPFWGSDRFEQIDEWLSRGGW